MNAHYGAKQDKIKGGEGKMKVKFKIVFLTTLLIMLSICGNVYASTQYYTGEKSDHARKETYLHGITAEMCTAGYWKDKTFYGLDKIIMNDSQIDTLNRRIVDGSGTMVFDLEEKKSQHIYQ